MTTTCKAQGWYVANGLRDLAGPFGSRDEAVRTARKIRRELPRECYFANGRLMPVWTPVHYAR